MKRQSIASSIKGWRSSQLLDKATAARESGDTNETQQLAIAAFQLEPGNLEALRILLTTNTPNSDLRVLNIANTVFIHPDATVEDRARCLGIYLAARDFRLFWRNFDALPREEKRHPDIQYLQAGYFAAQGEADLAIQVLEQGPQDDRRFRFLRTSLLSLSPDETKRNTGQQELARLITFLDPSVSNHAFRLIRNIPPALRNPAILKPAADQWIKNHEGSNVTVGDRLVIRTFEWLQTKGTENSKCDTIAHNTISELGSSHPLAVTNWLISLEQWKMAINFVAQAETKLTDDATDHKTKLALFELQLQALEATGRWEEQITLLDSAPEGISPMPLSVYRAVAAKHLGKASESARNWREAWNYAKLTEQKDNSYLNLYQWARRANEPDHAVRAMIEASKSQMGMLPPTHELTQFMLYLAENDRDDDLIALTDSLFWREAFSTTLINNAIYLRELTGNKVPKGEVVLKKLGERFPDVVGIQTNLILLYVNREQIAEALSVAEKLTNRYQMETLPGTETVIIAGAYRLAGKTHKRAELNLEKKFESLLGIEKRVFEKWFEQKQSTTEGKSAESPGSPGEP